MKVSVVGGGPAGLYFSLLLKKASSDHDVTVIERNPDGATYGWGVVFSDRTLSSFREADLKTYEQITESFIIWDAIDVRYRDAVVRCGGQVFSGIARKALLRLLRDRCEELGVDLQFERELSSPEELEGSDLIVAADGVRSTLRAAHEAKFRPATKIGRARYIWFGTERIFDSFTFAFRANEHGFFQAHAYPFDGAMSTFIVECDEGAWRAAGLDRASEAESIAYCEQLFAADLNGRKLISNASKWLQFPTLTNKRWSAGNVVLVGDAAHTAHFSIGSGTKMAMEDSIALVDSLVRRADVGQALMDYELERKPRVQRLQEAARQSQTFFETTRHYAHMDPLQFAFHLMARSGRIDYDDLRVADNRFVDSVDRWVSGIGQSSLSLPAAFAPLEAGSVYFPNRVVMRSEARYESTDGRPSSGSLVELATAGAGAVFTETVAVSANGRVSAGDPGIYSDTAAEAWASEVSEFKKRTTIPVGVTLGHAGPRGSTVARGAVADVTLPDGEGWALLAASPQRYTRLSPKASELSIDAMTQVVDDFRQAALRATQAGFDVLELHMGHGYLLASFISPLTNVRNDDYGGSLEGRMRFPLEVLAAVREEWPSEQPVVVAFSASDWQRGGLKLDEAVEAARMLSHNGCDLIRILAGQTTAKSQPKYDPYFLTYLSDHVRNAAQVKTIATGDIASIDRVNTIIAAGQADLCALRRI